MTHSPAKPAGTPQQVVDGCIAELTAAMAGIGAALALAHHLSAALAQGLPTPFSAPLNAPQSAAEIRAALRRAHRSGHPSKIALDPELRAFIVARPGNTTFAQITAEIAATFPPERRVALSTVRRSWQEHTGKLRKRNRQ